MLRVAFAFLINRLWENIEFGSLINEICGRNVKNRNWSIFKWQKIKCWGMKSLIT